jgi:hypothetical protein
MANLAVTPGTGATVGAELISGVLYSQAKLIDSTVGSTTPIGTAANPLPVSGTFYQTTQPISNASLVTIATNTGNIPSLGQALAAASTPVVLTAIQVTALTPPAAITGFAKESGGNLATLATNLPAQGQALAAASLPVVLTAIQTTALTPPSNTGYALDASLANVATIGAKTDAKSTATDATSVSAMQVLKEISAMVQAPASTPVTIASLPSGAVTNAGTFAVQAALNAETTKVIGTVNVAASQTVGLVAGSAVIGHVIADSGSTTAVTGNVTAIGQATGSTVPANAFYQGINPKTALPAAATAGNLVGATGDVFGRQVVITQAMRDIVLPMTQLTLTSTTTETSLIAAVASTFLDLVSVVVINTSATVCQVDFRDSTAGTIRLTLMVPPTDTRGVVYSVPLPQNAVNTAWTAKCGTSVASIIITGSYITNK